MLKCSHRHRVAKSKARRCHRLCGFEALELRLLLTSDWNHLNGFFRHLLRMTFADDFDPSADSTQWDEILNGTPNTTFGGDGNGLFMSGSPGRDTSSDWKVPTLRTFFDQEFFVASGGGDAGLNTVNGVVFSHMAILISARATAFKP